MYPGIMTDPIDDIAFMFLVSVYYLRVMLFSHHINSWTDIRSGVPLMSTYRVSM